MSTLTPKKPPFGMIEACIGGIRAVWAHRRLFGLLSVVPLIATFATMMAGRFLPDTALFFVPVVQFPASVVLGMQCALVIRFLVLREFPLIADNAQRLARNRVVLQSAFVYAAVQFFTAGIFSAMLLITPVMNNNPEAVAPYMPLFLAAFILLMWAARFLWLHVPVALGWQADGLFRRIGGWGGSFRVFGLFLLCSLSVNAVISLMWQLGRAVSGGPTVNGEGGGLFALFSDGVVALGTVAIGILFAAATAYAVSSMLQNTRIKVDA